MRPPKATGGESIGPLTVNLIIVVMSRQDSVRRHNMKVPGENPRLGRYTGEGRLDMLLTLDRPCRPLYFAAC